MLHIDCLTAAYIYKENALHTVSRVLKQDCFIKSIYRFKKIHISFLQIDRQVKKEVKTLHHTTGPFNFYFKSVIMIYISWSLFLSIRLIDRLSRKFILANYKWVIFILGFCHLPMSHTYEKSPVTLIFSSS